MESDQHNLSVAPKIFGSTLKGLMLLAVGLLLFGWLLNTPAGLLGKADAVGYAVCHRIDLRSFHLGDRQVPLCARCTGMYLGAMLGLAFQAIYLPRAAGTPPRRVWILMSVLVLAFGVDGLNSYLHFFPGVPVLYEPQNWLRLLSGTGMGIAVSAALYPAFNQTVWRNWSPDPALPGLKSAFTLVGSGLLLDMFILNENPLALYPLALISAAGVLVLLSMVYSMIWLIVLRCENRYWRARQLILPLTGGFGLAVLQIALIDFARYALTGTWDGFHLG